MALLFHRQSEAEQIYIQNKFYYRAVKMHIDGYRWEKALKLCRDFKVDLAIFVGLRKRYLERIKKEETNKQFLQAAQEAGEIDAETLDQKIKAEEEKEKRK